MTNSQVERDDKNPTNGTFTAQLVRDSVILEIRADEIRLRKTAFYYILDATQRGANVVFFELHLPLGITGNRDKYPISNPDGQVTATCDLKYTSDPTPLKFQAESGEITFYEFDTSTEKVHARFYIRARSAGGELLEVNGGEMQLVGIGL